MAMDRFLIAPSETGLQTDLRPFLIADDAWSQLDNAYIFRGRLRKRFGSTLMGTPSNQLTSRLRILITVTDGAGDVSGTVPGNIFKVGQLFSIGTEIFTVPALGTPVNMLTTGASTVHTYNTTTGALVINGAAINTDVYFYLAEPVMGFTIFENGPINNQPTYAFDTQFAYIFANGAWDLAGVAPYPLWHGSNLNFFWCSTYRYTDVIAGAPTSVPDLFVSNFYATNPNGAVTANDDPMWRLDSVTNAWTIFSPATTVSGEFILTSRIIVPFHDRLVLLNTIEVDSSGAINSNFVNRCRFSSLGSPITAVSFFNSNEVGATGGGFIDCPTAEAIVTAEFIKDRLIVYFERSTWELAWTSNDLLPFVWRQLNTELGSESTFSIIPFDQEVLAIGNTGVHSCNGSNVVRIDNKIPDTVFQIKNSGVAAARVAGIRDYFAEMVYWAYPSDNNISINVYPNKVLVFNYRNKSWSQNDDSITAFGYFEQGTSLTWANSAPQTWQISDDTWNSGETQAQARRVIGGNQEGFTFFVDPDLNTNANALQLTNVTLTGTVMTLTIIDHNLLASNRSDNGDYIYLSRALGSVNINDTVYPINSVVSKDVVTVIVPTGFTLGGVYTGAGLVRRVSNIKIKSKQWNPYDKDGSNVYIAKIDFAVQKTSFGEITVDYYPSASEFSMIAAGIDSGSITGNNVLETRPYPATLYPFEQVQDRLWHPVYFQSDGECIQIYMYFSDAQMRNAFISFSGFELEGLVLNTQKTSSRLQ